MSKEELPLTDKLAQKRTDLAAQRTIMAAERSLMAWIRTAISMIGFGFTLYTFLAALADKGTLLTMSTEGPRRVGLFLLAIGMLAIFFGSLEFIATGRDVKKITDIQIGSFSLILAALIFLLGMVLFISIFIKIHLI